MEMLDRDFYDVEIGQDGQKRIHVWGYCWCNDGGYHAEEFCFCYLAPGFSEEDYELAVDNCKHYISDCSEDEIANIMDGYRAEPLPMRSVTIDTPCGTYVDC